MSTKQERKKTLKSLLQKVYQDHYAHTGFDHPPLDDRRYQVMHYVGVVRDETGQRYVVLITGDPKWYLFYRLLGETSICIGDGFPVEKKSLPTVMRRALTKGWCNGTARAPQHALISYGPSSGPIDEVWVWGALEEVRDLERKPDYLVFASHEFTDGAIQLVEKIKDWDGIMLVTFKADSIELAIPIAPVEGAQGCDFPPRIAVAGSPIAEVRNE